MAQDYQPRTQPLIPVGYDCWLAVSRVKNPDIHRPSNEGDGPTVDQQIEWLLRAITAPGADCSQRHDDLISLAELIIKARGTMVVDRRSAATGQPTQYHYEGGENFGYGVKPIDSDTHDLDCKVCGNAKVYDQGGHDVDFDRHEYEMCQGTCDVHEGVHDFVNGERHCIGWRSYYPDEVAALNAR